MWIDTELEAFGALMCMNLVFVIDLTMQKVSSGEIKNLWGWESVGMDYMEYAGLAGVMVLMEKKRPLHKSLAV